MIPDNVEKIIMTKEDYDRNVEQLLVEKLELEHKYNLMKKNDYQLAMKIDKAIEYIELLKRIDNSNRAKNNMILVDSETLLEILKGEDK